jgi:hypothetical protein
LCSEGNAKRRRGTVKLKTRKKALLEKPFTMELVSSKTRQIKRRKNV